MTGIEPAYSAWEADILPLNYIGRHCKAVRFSLPPAHAATKLGGRYPGSCRAMAVLIASTILDARVGAISTAIALQLQG